MLRRSEARIGRPVLYALSLPLLLACSSPPRTEIAAGTEGWEGTAVEEDSTLTVRTLGGSVWGRHGRLIEETAIGTEARGEEDLLGRVVGMDMAGGHIFIADRIFKTVRVFDLAGNHVMNIGRQGGGPGEFRSITDLGIDPWRQHLVVREGTGVLHRFTLSGEYVRRIPTRGLFGSQSGASLMLLESVAGASEV